ncbi:chaplin [Streptomyces sp. NPDC003032]
MNSTAEKAAPDAQAHGTAKNPPGAGSGNLPEAPVHVPVNATGDSATVIGVLNPAFGNASASH